MEGNKNKKNERIEFNPFDFFSKKLDFKNNTIYFGSNVRLDELANLINISNTEALKLLGLNRLNPNHILNEEQIAEIAISKNLSFEKVDDVSEENILSKINSILKNKQWPKEVEFIDRTPVVTIMGHVDHGKTTLLDFIRKANVAGKEAGGITQKIGAYQIERNNKKISFIDTPGHEAFTEMRANGSKVTDIAIVVIAADDSIMPQTKESIEHAKAANVPIIVAVNKMDKVGADIEKVKQELTSIDVMVEEWGGDVPIVPISALKGEGIDELLDVIQLNSELLDLKVPLNILASGTVIESNVDKRKGSLVSIIVKNGILKIGDTILIDDQVVKVKSLYDENGKIVKEARPGTPVEIYGLGFTPVVGTNFFVSKAKGIQKIADTLHEQKLNSLRKRKVLSPLELLKNSVNNKKELNIILKANSLGVLSAMSSKIEQFSNEDIDVKIIRKDVGEITNADVSLAEASKAIIYQFDLKTPTQIEPMIKSRGVNVLSFDIIYKLFEDIQDKVSGSVEDKFEEVKIGTAEVRQKFEFSKIGSIAGSMITDGVIKRDSIIKVYRKNNLIAETVVSSLRVEKDNIKEVKKGKECGIVLKDFNEFTEGDIFEVYELKKV